MFGNGPFHGSSRPHHCDTAGPAGVNIDGVIPDPATRHGAKLGEPSDQAFRDRLKPHDRRIRVLQGFKNLILRTLGTEPGRGKIHHFETRLPEDRFGVIGGRRPLKFTFFREAPRRDNNPHATSHPLIRR